ncbi:VOC family protein [Truepera radiovictrix]|uniref:Glyoxalase-like domain-containing protein n=1 Tax=Truepera radiovictrix (strain DSM 17093 / CIP 108686 / LMG 22925 / RQ-24) TaxID=649638 RepID=D7CVL2_TRURR|nr:VOC family protein [Truepera radiovictrix]ADI15923.1 conserved hypothetical protein [Truepera radiovictrix DSM 17093]WMT58450.1 VOC family protein [Truepera radiovictrix]
MHALDHLLWEEWRLEEGERRFFDLTGVAPARGGSHSVGGTHNSLLSLGERAYLELIAPHPTHPSGAALPKEAPPEFVPRLFAFAVSGDLNLVERLAIAAGLTVSLTRGSRRTPEGTLVTWQTAFVKGHAFGASLPFFVRFGGAHHPAQTAPKGCRLLEFSVGHPHHEALSRLYTALEIGVPVVAAEHPLLRAKLETPKGVLVLDSREGCRALPDA